jgi:ABC-2 type transport system ATP-binding protein
MSERGPSGLMTQTAPAAGPAAAKAGAIVCRELHKDYGDVHALQGLDLEVPPASLFGLIGPNGAGKSTALAIIATLLERTSGTVEVAGADPSKHPDEVRRHVGFMPDVMGVYDNLSVDEYLRFFAAAYHIPTTSWDALVDSLLDLVDLGDKRTAMVDSLSRGMKQRLSLARSLVHDPAILVLDEPASGLDPRARVDLRTLLVDLRHMGKTVLISSHILAELEEMCSHVAIVESGRVLIAGSPADIRRRVTGQRQVRVRLAGGEVQIYDVPDEVEQQELVYQLVAVDELPVVEVTEVDAGLEQLFLQVTDTPVTGAPKVEQTQEVVAPPVARDPVPDAEPTPVAMVTEDDSPSWTDDDSIWSRQHWTDGKET